jgi:hypothetical protein
VDQSKNALSKKTHPVFIKPLILVSNLMLEIQNT